MACFTLIYCVVWPALFWSFHWSKTNTKHKWTIKLTFKLGPMKMKWLSPHKRSLFLPGEKYEKYTSDACFNDPAFWSRINSSSNELTNESFYHSTSDSPPADRLCCAVDATVAAACCYRNFSRFGRHLVSFCHIFPQPQQRCVFYLQHNVVKSITYYNLITSLQPFLWGSRGCIWQRYRLMGKFWRKSQSLRGIWLPPSIICTVSNREARHLSSVSFASSTPALPVYAFTFFISCLSWRRKMLTFPSKYINSTSSKNILNGSNLVCV